MAAIGSVLAISAAGWLVNKFGSLRIVIGRIGVWPRAAFDCRIQYGSDKRELPVPGTFVIDRRGVVRFAQVDPNFMTGRATPEAVLAILTKLSPHREGK